MPNPLLRKQANTSERPPANRTVEPDVPARILPYRGIETHGVPINAIPDVDPDEADYGTTVGVPIEPVDPEPDPVPVRVVNTSGRESRRFLTLVGYARGTDNGVSGREILPRDDNRTRATIKVPTTATQTVWISHSPDLANSVNGYPLEAGKEYPTESQYPIFASVSQAADQQVFIAAEVRQEIP